PAGQRAVLHGPADPGRPVHHVGRGPRPRIGGFPLRDEALELLAELAGSGRLAPRRDVARELPVPQPLVAALATVAAVEQQVHRRRAEGPSGCAESGVATDAENAPGCHSSLLTTFVRASSISSSPCPESTLLVAYKLNPLTWSMVIVGGSASSC